MRWYFFPFQRCLGRDECRVRLKRNVCMQLEILGSPTASYAISTGSLVVSMFSFALTAYTAFNMNDKFTSLERRLTALEKRLTELEKRLTALELSVIELKETTIKKFW